MAPLGLADFTLSRTKPYIPQGQIGPDNNYSSDNSNTSSYYLRSICHVPNTVLSTFHAPLIQSSQHPYEVGMIIPILQMRTLRIREIE